MERSEFERASKCGKKVTIVKILPQHACMPWCSGNFSDFRTKVLKFKSLLEHHW